MKKVIDTTVRVSTWNGDSGTVEATLQLPLEAVVVAASGLKGQIDAGMELSCQIVCDASVIRILEIGTAQQE